MAAGGTSIMQVISPRTPAAKRLPFPHIRAIFLLIETHSAATAFSRAGKWQVKIWRHLSPSSLPPSGKSGCEVDKFFEGNWSLSSEDNRRFWGYGEVTAHILPCLFNQPGPNVCTPLWLSYSEGFCGEKRGVLWGNRHFEGSLRWRDSICIWLALSGPGDRFMSPASHPDGAPPQLWQNKPRALRWHLWNTVYFSLGCIWPQSFKSYLNLMRIFNILNNLLFRIHLKFYEMIH